MGFRTGIRTSVLLTCVAAAFLAVVTHAAYAATFNQNYVTGADAEHTRVLDGGNVVNLVLDQLLGNT
jgi:ferric-dicitrate binding protein FerR (iron transport regulator)